MLLTITTKSIIINIVYPMCISRMHQNTYTYYSNLSSHQHHKAWELWVIRENKT